MLILVGTLGTRSLFAGLVAVGIVLGIGFAAGLVRLLPWVFAPEVPLEVALPFARALGAKATETAFLIGAPLGFCLAAASFVERGEARALHALGVSPARLAQSAFGHALIAAVLAFGAGLAWGSSADSPGRFAAQLVRQGRASCARAAGPKSATVPLVGVTWLCFPGQAPRVTGPLPGTSGRAWFSAAELLPSDDLTEVRLVDLRLATRKDSNTPYKLDLYASAGVVRGLPTWGRSARLPQATRGVLMIVTVLLVSVFGSFAVIKGALVRRWQALIVGGSPAAVAVIALGRLDASTSSRALYALVPLACLAALAIAAVCVRKLARAPSPLV